MQQEVSACVIVMNFSSFIITYQIFIDNSITGSKEGQHVLDKVLFIGLSREGARERIST